jgi:Sulfotransferase family
MNDRNRIRAAYLAGTSYCGSTLLAFLLNSHPQIVSVGESSLNRKSQKKKNLDYACSCGVLLNDCEFWKEIFKMVRSSGLEFNIHNWTNDYKYKNDILHRFLSTYPSRKMLRAFQKVAFHIMPFHKSRVQYVNTVNIAFMQSAIKLAHAAVFFDTSKALMRLSYLLEIPEIDLKVVRVIRDVRAFANSYKSRGVPIERAAQHWRNYQLSADYLLHTVPSSRVLVMRYEDFCHAPLEWLKSLHTFLGVPPCDPPETINPDEHHIIGNHMRLQKITAITANQSWQKKLTSTEITQILQIAGDINERFGYRLKAGEEITHTQNVASVRS